jgi:DNA (cytosine-5)-methyltransferase 1
VRYGSVCSGVEAATVAWHPLGWRPVFFSEIEKFPRAVLQSHYPNASLHGDFTTIKGDEYGPIDLLVGGTPCQNFSVAGLRKGLSDERGNLALENLKLAARTGPKWLVWENVPGVLSSGRGRDFGSFLGALAQLGYGYAWRVLDAQYFGVAQRRRRVFLVGYFGDWRPAAEVLFDRESLRGNPPPCRKAGEGVAGTLKGGSGTRGCPDPGNGDDGAPLASCFPINTQMALRGADTSNSTREGIGIGECNSAAFTLQANHSHAVAYGFKAGQGAKAGNIGFEKEVSPTLAPSESGTNRTPAILNRSLVRRLTPVECERLQGFPDGYTAIPWRGKPASECPDGPRYKALGNSMAVPVMRWIGERISVPPAVFGTPD